MDIDPVVEVQNGYKKSPEDTEQTNISMSGLRSNCRIGDFGIYLPKLQAAIRLRSNIRRR